MIKKIGVLTSGGDSPGMNAVIRAVVRSGIFFGLEVYGIQDGYLGLFHNRIYKLSRYSVSDIINKGGTFLGTSRFEDFKTSEIRSKIYKKIVQKSIDALIIIGGDGTYVGAYYLNKIGLPCITIPGTIDNDVPETDYSIGYFTALQTIVDAIDRIRDTSTSHKRISLIEVMGRYCSDLTMSSGIACGCEFIIIPEINFNKEKLLFEIVKNFKNGKKHVIIVITEYICNVFNLTKYIEKKTGRETRATVLGHIQRGGIPLAYDRILGSRMGDYAIKLLISGYQSRCIGIKRNKLVHNDIFCAINNTKRVFQKDIFDVSKRLL